MTAIELKTHRSFRILLFALLTTALSASFGCQRTPEDLEQWRNAKGGMEQLSEWAQSDKESSEVRVRAVQIIVEEKHHDRVPRILDHIEDEEVRAAAASGAWKTIKEMWDSDEIPEFTEELQAGGGEIPIGATAEAKDAAYRLHPYLVGEDLAAAEELFREWISAEQDFRNQIGDVGIPMLIGRAGEGAIELVADWIKETYEPREVVGQLRRNATVADHDIIDKALMERAIAEQEENGELSRDMKLIISHAESDAIAPFLEQVISDEATDTEFLQAAVDALVHVSGADATDFFASVISERTDILRWVSAQAILDGKFPEGIVDIARALPSDASTYPTSPSDDLKTRTTFVCNYFNTNVEREEIDNFDDPLTVLLSSDEWPAQLLGIQCASRTSAVGVADAVERLKDNSQQVPAWGERKTIGNLATEAHDKLSTVAAGE